MNTFAWRLAWMSTYGPWDISWTGWACTPSPLLFEMLVDPMVALGSYANYNVRAMHFDLLCQAWTKRRPLLEVNSNPIVADVLVHPVDPSHVPVVEPDHMGVINQYFHFFHHGINKVLCWWSICPLTQVVKPQQIRRFKCYVQLIKPTSQA